MPIDTPNYFANQGKRDRKMTDEQFELLRDLIHSVDNVLDHPEHQDIRLRKHGWPCSRLDFCVFSSLKRHRNRVAKAIGLEVSVAVR